MRGCAAILDLEGFSVNLRQFMDGLKEQYPAMLHPTEKALGDTTRILASFKYSEKQLQTLYDEVIKTCAYFPRTADITTVASSLAFDTEPRKKFNAPVYKTVQGKDNYVYAEKLGSQYYESDEEKEARYHREAMSSEEGGAEYFKIAYLDGALSTRRARIIAGAEVKHGSEAELRKNAEKALEGVIKWDKGSIPICDTIDFKPPSVADYDDSEPQMRFEDL